MFHRETYDSFGKFRRVFLIIFTFWFRLGLNAESAATSFEGVFTCLDPEKSIDWRFSFLLSFH